MQTFHIITIFYLTHLLLVSLKFINSNIFSVAWTHQEFRQYTLYVFFHGRGEKVINRIIIHLFQNFCVTLHCFTRFQERGENLHSNLLYWTPHHVYCLHLLAFHTIGNIRVKWHKSKFLSHKYWHHLNTIYYIQLIKKRKNVKFFLFRK